MLGVKVVLANRVKVCRMEAFIPYFIPFFSNIQVVSFVDPATGIACDLCIGHHGQLGLV